MAQRSHVPSFGNWESEEDVPYTAYFDRARKNRSGGMVKQTDPPENPNMVSNSTPPVRVPNFQMETESGTQKEQEEAVRTKHVRSTSREDGDIRRLTDSPLGPNTVGRQTVMDLAYQLQGGVIAPKHEAESEAPNGQEALRPKHRNREDGDPRRPNDPPLRYDTANRRVTTDSPLHGHGGISSGDAPKRAMRQNTGSDRSIEHSPLHPHYQAKVGGKASGVSSPSWERKGSSEGGSHGLAPLTPGRSRLRSVTRGNESPDHSATVPKFGDWDETDPASADGFSHIFNKVREEKHGGAGGPAAVTQSPYSIGQNQHGQDDSKRCCCFPWGGK